ncbi:Stk1 family PASTA domain-containing Ser/Thr kinase [Dysosmobacter sp.]|uniref:Stk1 family PASTA domain-containing Ser/Thr kinase n=1 Tax=Dysosmobacter sp. TaxID=2591382 RepID=UPI002A980BC2|nr:Stk1 family PASTA domain-containing Ser/Thr kinase [Dysosmobacter sp.]MDY5612154.1 Stk1 family PASTA domain-containing Ser/Thr kinase [Dysosmobacter sp.]
MDPYIGKMLDNRYEILERIGTGGMAVVYKAKCHRLNRLVAVKILKADLAQDEDFRRRFNAESQAVAQLSHPNIVSVYDVSRGGDTEYIVMELIDGITLKQYMEKRGQLNWRESLHFITQIMRGLSHAHSRGIIHRDIKPQNIMVLRDGSVKVADFGIACLENSAQTLTQEALGSVHYISPEQARGDRTDARSDIYSAGVVLYEMLTGRLPFEGDSAVSVAIQHLSSIPLAPREINKDIPEQLELICMKAMTAAPEKRYPSADTMIVDLEAFRKNPGVSLDFELSDLRPEETDEPTQLLRTGGARTAVTTPHYRTTPAREQPRCRDYEEDDEPAPKPNWKRTTLLVVAGLLAVALAVTLLSSILKSVNTPVDQYVVKSVLGLTVEQAQELEGIKGVFEIKVADERVFSDTYPVDTIAKQNPAENDIRKPNTVIEVWLSAGEDTGKMIDVTGMTIAQADRALSNLKEKYKLTIDIPDESEYQFHNTMEAGHIISTIPAKEEELKKGDTITLVVSKGKDIKEIQVPKFVGMSYDQALKQVENAGLICLGADTVDSDRPGGEIIWQSLNAYSTAKEGDGISFKVSSGLSTVRREFTVELPQDDRTTVELTVYVGNEAEPQFSATLNCSDEVAAVTVTGSGNQFIKVCFDGIMDQNQSYYLQFN